MDKASLFQKIGLTDDTAQNQNFDQKDRKNTARLIEQDENSALAIVAQFGSEGVLYEKVLQVRIDENGCSSSFEFDTYSTHYVLFCESDAIGSLTVTRHVDGAIDCKELYPPVLFNRHGDVLASICKFRIHPGPHSSMKTFRMMVRAVWRDLLRLGVRVDVINIEKSNLAAFRRIGYVAIDNSDFIHPKLGTDSIAMVLSADPTHKSFFSDLFETEVDTPVLMADLVQEIRSSQHTAGEVSKSSLPLSTASQPILQDSQSKEDKWAGYAYYQHNSKSISEYYRTTNHCLSLALHESLSDRCELALDIACGAGMSTRIISRFADRVIGVDSSAELIQKAKAEELGKRFEFIESRFEDYQCEDATFDLLSASWYLNYLHNDAELNSFISRVTSILKPGGHIAFVVPAASYASETIQTIARNEFGWRQATLETQPDFTRVVFSYGDQWIVTTNWQPLKLMRLLDKWFHIQAWDVKATLAYERRLEMLNTEPPFEIIYGKLRQKRGK